MSAIFAPVGYQALNIGAGANATLTVPAGTRFAVLRAETSAVRWRDDGTVPIATTGMPMLPADPPYVHNGDATKISFFAAAAAVVHAVFYK